MCLRFGEWDGDMALERVGDMVRLGRGLMVVWPETALGVPGAAR